MCSVGSVWAETTLFSTNFSTTDGWKNESIITSTTTSASKTIKGTTISFKGYKSTDVTVSNADASGGTLTFTSNNITASEGTITSSNPNYYITKVF